MRAEEDDYWRRYDALCLDLHVRPWSLQFCLSPSRGVSASGTLGTTATDRALESSSCFLAAGIYFSCCVPLFAGKLAP